MASSAEEGTILLYYQQTKREHRHLLKMTEQFTDSLRKADAMYEATLEQEKRVNDMDQKLTALAEDNDAMKKMLKKTTSETHGRLDKYSLDSQSLSRKILRLETLEKEHGTRAHNNGTLLRDIQYKLSQLESTVEDLSKFKGKVNKHADHPEMGRLSKEVESLRGMLHDQNKNVNMLRQNLDDTKATFRQSGSRVAQEIGTTREPSTQPKPQPEVERRSTVQPQTPPPARAKKTTKRREPVHSARLSKRQTIISPNGSKKSTLPFITSGPVHTPYPASKDAPRGVSMAQTSKQRDRSSAGQMRVPKGRSPISKVPTRRSVRLSEKTKGQASYQPQMGTASSGQGSAGSAHLPSRRQLMVHMNQSYPHIQAPPRLSESSNAMGLINPETDQRAGSRLTVRTAEQAFEHLPADGLARHEQQPHKPPPLVPQPRKRKKRELPPMNPLPPYED